MLTSCAITRLSQTTRLSSTTPCALASPVSSVPDIDHDAAGRCRRPGGLHFEVGFHQRRDIGARDERQDQHGHDRRRDEGEEQLAIETGAHLAQQRPARAGRAGSDETGQKAAEQDDDVDASRERDELGQAHRDARTR